MGGLGVELMELVLKFFEFFKFFLVGLSELFDFSFVVLDDFFSEL